MNKQTLVKLGQWAGIVAAIPAIAGMISWGVVASLPDNIRTLPDKVEAIQHDVDDIKTALHVPDRTVDTRHLATTQVEAKQ